MLRYFGYLLFPCLNYQPILGQCFLSLPQGHIKEKHEGFCRFQWVSKRNICLKLVNNIVVGLLFCFHFAFCFVFLLSILKGPTLHYFISRLFHLNEICDFIVSEQVSFQSRYQYVSGKSQKKEKVTLSVYYDNHISYAMIIICYFSSGMHSLSIYLLMHLKHKARMSLAFPSASLLGAISRQK